MSRRLMRALRSACRVQMVSADFLECRKLMAGSAFTNLANFAPPLNSDPEGGLVVGADHNLYGTTAYGGTNNSGTVFEINTSTGTLTTIVNFNSSGGTSPSAGLVLGSDGNFYGTTTFGGSNGDGTVYEVNASTHAVTTLVNFNSNTGIFSVAALVLGSDQNLYGTTRIGGTYNDGTVFELTSASHTFTTLANFNSGTGSQPYAPLVVGPDQNLYGTTYSGGTNGDGTVFELNSVDYALTTLVSFNSSTGVNPLAGLVVGYDQNLYGVNPYGGAYNEGTVFELAGSKHALSTLVNFDASNGEIPTAAMIVGPDHNLYGTTSNGGSVYSSGTLFEIDANSHAMTSLYAFGLQASEPSGPLVLGPDNNFYGMTGSGGTGSFGTVYKWNSSSHIVTTIANFYANSGEGPRSPLLLGPDQNFYGTTTNGGIYGGGSVYEMNSSTHVLTTLDSFDGSDGEMPYGGLVLGPDQNFYGTTPYGGGGGTVFEVNSSNHALTTIVNFNTSTGTNPQAALTLGPDNNFYGTTFDYGSGGKGTVFEINGSTHVFTVIASFNGSNGSNPEAALTVGADKNLYGTTYYGGTHQYGTVFEINTSSHALTTIANFNDGFGSYSSAQLILGADQNLYGVTVDGPYGGAGSVVFEINSSNHALTSVATLNREYAYTGLVLGVDQNIYGTCDGGIYGDAVFEINGQTHAFLYLSGFNSSIGVNPFAPLVLGADKNLYGTTYSGGTGDGTVFELTPPTPLNVSSGTTTLPPGSGPAITINTYNGITISAGATLALAAAGSHASRTLVTSSGLNLASNGSIWTSSIDLGDNDLDIAGGSLSTVNSQVQQGFAGGTWAGTGGIDSSSAAADKSHLTALGVIQNEKGGNMLFGTFDGDTVSPTDILVKYTFYGDANLSGIVDSADYTLIDAGYLQHLTGWYNGDFNYDHVINGSDYTLIDNAFNTQGASLAVQVAGEISTRQGRAIFVPALDLSSPGTSASAAFASPANVVAGIFATGDDSINSSAKKRIFF